ncbi:hypothetical protein SynA1562_02826 [Synechococcus sp. A15-62]|nr:hypothetical protein SynA1562_02826 [Synechococcus sp. A15-62]
MIQSCGTSFRSDLEDAVIQITNEIELCSLLTMSILLRKIDADAQK